jgi:ferritin-like metal-binding protein YciE
MTEKTLDDQLTAYLADAHSIEEQALQQLRGAPDAAGDPQLAEIFRQHLTETEGHERTTRELLDARGEQPSKVKDLLMRVGGAGFLLFARAQPDTPGKLVAHAYSYEHMEFASAASPSAPASRRSRRRRRASPPRRSGWASVSPSPSTGRLTRRFGTSAGTTWTSS